jgi:hypothetical protein
MSKKSLPLSHVYRLLEPEMPRCRILKIGPWRHVPPGIHHHNLTRPTVIVPGLAGHRTAYRMAAWSMKLSTDAHSSRHDNSFQWSRMRETSDP